MVASRPYPKMETQQRNRFFGGERMWKEEGDDKFKHSSVFTVAI